MNFSDIIFVLRWWLVFFVIGLIFLPLATRIFSNFFDKGYIFARILGMALISYVVFLLGILKILPLTEATIFIVILTFIILNVLISKFSQKITSEESFHNTSEVARQRPRLLRGGRWKIFLLEEILFLTALFFWSFIRAHEPSIHGLEKYMDFGFVNSIIRSEYFPPRDMWLTPHSINYYYFGHLVTAILTKISYIPSSITYNLMLSTVFALTFTGAFSIGANLISKFEARNSKQYQMTKIQNSKRFGNSDLDQAKPENLFRISNFGFRIFAGGLLSGFLISLAGNLHAIYTFFKPYVNENPIPFWQLAFSFNTFPNSYWYPNATRFIHNTIHEFPIYSFVVSDLHGHFLDIPFVLLTIAILFSLFINLKIENLKLKILLISFLLAVLYMTNAWDGIIYFLLAALVILFIFMKQGQTSPMEIKNENFKLKIIRWLFYISIVLVGSILFSLPFSLSFKPFASGIGILCAPEFLTNIEHLGPFLFEKDHCQRSPLWQLAILYGFFYFWVISFIIFLFKISKHKARNSKQYKMTKIQNSKRFGHLEFDQAKPENLFRISNFEFRISSPDVFVLILIFISTLLIIIPEFIYIKDIYPGHYRANTMFKLVYQAFIMLSIASAYIAVCLISKIKNQKSKIFNFYYVYLPFTILFFILVMVYPYFAINSYYNLKTYQGLDGLKYLKPLYPTDYEGILWINKNIKGQPVILEAQGDSYTDYARVSSNTGLPTVLGWTVHEWLWRGTYDIPSPRIPEVQTLYESESIEDTKKLINKYNIQLVFIGDLEKEKYPKLNEEKFNSLGEIIYKNGSTKIYKINK